MYTYSDMTLNVEVLNDIYSDIHTLVTHSILAVMWLARELSTSDTWKERMVIIVSHDRAFMDEVCTDCLHISGAAKRLTQCRGNYSKWAKERREQQVG